MRLKKKKKGVTLRRGRGITKSVFFFFFFFFFFSGSVILLDNQTHTKILMVRILALLNCKDKRKPNNERVTLRKCTLKLSSHFGLSIKRKKKKKKKTKN